MTEFSIKQLGMQNYETVWKNMQDFTSSRIESTTDEIWFVEHPPVFTLGQAGKQEHILKPDDIPVIHVDRGGQVTYHGPGQTVAYLMVDLKRRGFKIRGFVNAIENAVIKTLSEFGIQANTREKAPGVYVNEAKICALGLRVKRGCSYHGLALNVNMDLEPFGRINPCGFKGLQVTQMGNFVPGISIEQVNPILSKTLTAESRII